MDFDTVFFLGFLPTNLAAAALAEAAFFAFAFACLAETRVPATMCRFSSVGDIAEGLLPQWVAQKEIWVTDCTQGDIWLLKFIV